MPTICAFVNETQNWHQPRPVRGTPFAKTCCVCCHRRFHSIVAIAALFLINWRSRPTATRNRFIAMNSPLTLPRLNPSLIALTRSCFGPSSVSSIPIMFHFLPLSFFMPHTQCALSVSSAVDSHLSSSSSCDNAAGLAVAVAVGVAVVVAFVSHVKNTPSEFGMCHNSSARGVATSSLCLTFCRTRTRVWG